MTTNATFPPSYGSRNKKLAERRHQDVADLIQRLHAAGLEDCKTEASFFKSLGIGEGHQTSYLQSNRAGAKNRLQQKSKVREQWWAPSELVQLNVIMRAQNISSKVRARNLRGYMEGKELSPAAAGAVAIYTERILCK